MLYFTVDNLTRVTTSLAKCKRLADALRARGHTISEVRQISGELERSEEEIARVIKLLEGLPPY